MQLNGEVRIKTEFILPLDRPKKTYPSRPIKYVIRDNGCWEVTSHKKRTKGYPGTYYQGKCVLVDRIVWMLYHGEIPKQCVLHKCDNRECINPNHLFLGTKGDNARDMKQKGRSLKGEKHPRTKLTDADIRHIRKNPAKLRQVDLAKQFGVKKGVISRAINKHTWKHLDIEEV